MRRDYFLGLGDEKDGHGVVSPREGYQGVLGGNRGNKVAKYGWGHRYNGRAIMLFAQPQTCNYCRFLDRSIPTLSARSCWVFSGRLLQLATLVRSWVVACVFVPLFFHSSNIFSAGFSVSATQTYAECTSSSYPSPCVGDPKVSYEYTIEGSGILTYELQETILTPIPPMGGSRNWPWAIEYQNSTGQWEDAAWDLWHNFSGSRSLLEEKYNDGLNGQPYFHTWKYKVTNGKSPLGRLLVYPHRNYEAYGFYQINSTVTQKLTWEPGPPEQPDLTITDISSPSNAKAGEQIFVSATVSNQGAGDAGTFRTNFFLSIDEEITLQDIDTTWGCIQGPLMKGAYETCSGDITLPGNLANRVYYFGAYADVNNAIAEISEADNGGASHNTLTIGSGPSGCTIINGGVCPPSFGVTITNPMAGSYPVGHPIQFSHPETPPSGCIGEQNTYWNFGDGTTSAGLNNHKPEAHAYEYPGKFRVKFVYQITTSLTEKYECYNEDTYVTVGDSIFGDLSPSSWAYEYIRAIRDAGITGGCGNGNYCPQGLVTREQMAAFLVRAVEGEPAANSCGGSSYFSDVPPDAWSCPHIKRLSELNITGGCGGGKYCPQGLVTRDQMAAFIVRAVEGEPAMDYCGGGAPFQDVAASAWSCRYIKRLAELNVTQGCGNGNYCPYDTVTREQMAAFLARAFLGMD